MDGMVDFLLKTTNVASAVASSGPELPNIGEFLPPEILFQGTPFAMNRIILVRVLMAVVVMIIFGIGAARAKLVPGTGSLLSGSSCTAALCRHRCPWYGR